jgi:uncharacterized SAM-binding protein YcdF (DUF218 family)
MQTTPLQGLARSLVTVSAAVLAVLLPRPQTLLQILENRFPPWRDSGAQIVAGIIVVGGTDLSRWTPDGNSALRVRATADLAKQFPSAKIIYSGGGSTPSEAEQGRTILIQLGIEPNRIVVETQSRSTAENARFSRELVHLKGPDRWVLVTSAFHMPRAIGSFRAAGFSVEAYPVDFRCGTQSDFSNNFSSLKVALREYLALAVYRVFGRTLELFPAPESEVLDASMARKPGA